MYGWLQYVLARAARPAPGVLRSELNFASVSTPATPARGPAAAAQGFPPAAPLPQVRPRLGDLSALSGGRWVQALYVVTDILFVCLNGALLFSLRFLPGMPVSLGGPVDAATWRALADEYAAFLLLYAGLVVLCCQSQSLYRTLRTRTALDESLAVLKAVALATLLLTAFIYLSGVKSVSRLVVVLTGLATVAALAAWRLWKRRIVERRVARGIGARNVLIVGAGRVGQALAGYLERSKHLGYVFKGFLDENHSGDPRLRGRVEDLARVAQAEFADEIFITIPSQRELVKRIALESRQRRLGVKVVPELYDGLGWNAPLSYIGDYPVMELHSEPIPALGLIVKRATDIAFSAVALVVLAPVFAVLAALVKLDSPGPVLYRAPRVGRKGLLFLCYKFRSMAADAEAAKAVLRQQNERNGPFFKMATDPRVTRLGRFLRRYSLDELPQFWNVLRGEMSLVGPRPHPVDDFERYSLDDLRRLDVKPGLTGLWQVTAREDPSFETNLALDLEYIETWDLWLDVKILLRTLPAALRGTGR
jgi:exopolysaccharide biosynthesis polyprenyl glycosylphosphotransferase